MGADTAISYVHSTFNIAIGCNKISPACAHCYAERDMANPQYGNRYPHAWGDGEGAKRYTLSDTYWKQPHKWNKEAQAAGERRRVFCSSLCDVFEDHPVLNEERKHLWPLIIATPWLDWLLLTKRASNAQRMWPWEDLWQVPKNIWLGVTAENQMCLDGRVPILLNIPARVHFISAEPMLGALDAKYYLGCTTCENVGQSFDGEKFTRCPGCFAHPHLDWVICGGESGDLARPTKLDWVRSLRDQCAAAHVPFHFKQWGELTPEGTRVGRKQSGRLVDGVTHDALPELL